MSDSDKKPVQGQDHKLGGRAGSLAPLVLVNGFVLSAAAFVILYFLTGNMTSTDARNMTRDVFVTIEQSARGMEKAVRGLGYLYASVNGDDKAVKAADSAEKFLISGVQMSAFLWATEKGVWHYSDVRGQAEKDSYDPAFGLPDYQELYRKTLNLDDGQIGYLQKMPWKAVKDRPESAEISPVGLILRARLADGSNSILLVVTTPEGIFGDNWKSRRGDIARVLIRNRDTGDVAVDAGAVEEAGFFGLSGPVAVSDILQVGEQYWDVRFDVRPTLVSRILGASSWISLALFLSLTLFAAAFMERKRRQDMKMDAMSRSLEGAHSQLQSKISERDQLFHALRKSERENRAVINSVSDVIFELDENGKLVFLNETWKRMTHKEVSDTLGQSLFLLIDPTDQVRQREMFEELVRGARQSYRTETRLPLPQGPAKPVEIAFSMLRMAEDKSVRVVGTITDIEKRRQAEAAMREAEQRFRAIFENSVSGICQISPDGRFIRANSAMAEILGYPSAEDMILSVTDIAELYVRPEDRVNFVQKLLFEGRVSGIESEVRRKDGKLIWIMENARVVRSEKGGVEYYEGSVWDVTERHEAEETLRQARMQAEMSSRSRMEFIANMSHELRTPLNAVIGFAEILKDEIMGPMGVPAYKEYARDIYEGGSHLLKIISEILEVSKIESGSRDLDLSHLRLSKVLKSCMTILQGRIEQAGVEVKIDIPEKFPELVAEELGFKQIMLNLIGNAVKFTEKGGKVRVAAKVIETGEVLIDVIDNGVGMSAEEIRRAMQPFGKVDMSFSSRKAGTGLGLTIVDSLVRLHGGRFELISEKGRGTTARIIMPASHVVKQPPVVPPAEPPQLKVVK